MEVKAVFLFSAAAVASAFALSAVAAGPGAVSDDSLMFRATFDGYSTTPEFAEGARGTPGGIPPDLQMRMDAGEDGMGNVLSLSNPEFVSYPLRGNFRPDRGTVSFWVKPCDYTLSDVTTYQIFFSATAPGYELYVYKYPQRPNVALFYLRSGDVRKFACGKAQWRPGDWHKLDAAWDPNSISVYVDGILSDTAKFDIPFKLPRSLPSGQMGLNIQKGFKSTVDGRKTSYDRLEVYGRKLTAQEVFDNYRLVRRDAKADSPISEEKEEVRLTYRCLPGEAKLSVSLDLWAVDMKARENIPVRLSLVSRKSGKAVCSAEVVYATPDSSADLPFGDRLSEGETYDVVAEIHGAKAVSKSAFHVPDMSFLRHRAGVDDSVPAPWTEVSDNGNGAFSVLDRTYRFSRGVLPAGVVCRGEELLVSPPEFRVGGRPVEWSPFRIVSRRRDRVLLAAEGRVGDLSVLGGAELWFDGFCKVRVRFDPGGKQVEVKSLDLSWKVAADAARYLLTPVYRAWKDGRYDGTFGTEEYSQDQMVWTTGVEKGLCWWCESTANWSGPNDRMSLHAVRRADGVEVSAEIVSEKVALSRPADFVMGFQATPVKRPERLYRSRYYSASGSFGDWTTGGWGIGGGRPGADNMVNWTSYVPMDPKAFRAFIANRKANGMAVLNYSQPALISVRDEPWDYFNALWCRTPHSSGGFKALDGKHVPVYSCCGHTGAADWHLFNIEKLCRDYPDHGGLYFDICDVKFCNNGLHGDGGVDAFGKPYQTSNALHMREYFLRVYKVAKAYGKRVHIHAHNKYYPLCHSFADACWPGEEQYYAYAQNPEYHYVEGIGEEEYQAAWSPEIRGMGVYMIAQNSRSSKYGDYKDRPELFFSRKAVMTSLLPSLLYDFKSLGGCFGKSNGIADDVFRKMSALPLGDAVFHGYWYDPHAEVAGGLRTALYTWKGGGRASFLLVVGNTSRKDAATGLKLDWGKAGVAASPLRDLLSGVVKSESEWASTVLPSHYFLLLVPEGPASPETGNRVARRVER